MGQDAGLPHFTNIAERWETELALTNPDSITSSASIQAYSPSGDLIGETTLDLPGTEGLRISITDLFPELPEETGWLRVSSSLENLGGIMLFRDLITGGEPSLPLIRETGPHLLLPLPQNDTNYILLGMIIEDVGGDSYLNQLHNRLFEPLGLSHTYLAGDEPVPGRSRRYFVDPDQGLVDITDDVQKKKNETVSS